MIDATVETFDDLVGEGDVLVDIWGPQCQPCLALMPAVEALARALRRPGPVREGERAGEPQGLPRPARGGLPAYLTMRDGVEVERLTGNGTTPDQIEAAIVRLLERRARGGAAGPRASAREVNTRGGDDEHGARGKKVIALGERDSVPGEAIAEVARAAPAPR